MINNQFYQAKAPFKKPIILAFTLATSTLTGCANWISQESYISNTVANPTPPAEYNSQSTPLVQASPTLSIDTVEHDGLNQQSNLHLRTQISLALVNNPSIKSQQALVDQARQQKIIVAAEQGLNLSVNNANSIRTSSQSSVANKNFDLALQGTWKADAWGSLSAQSRVAQYQLDQSLVNLQHSQNKLIADITSAWYQLIYHQKLLSLVIEQQTNTAQQLSAIETSYQRGLNQSLDVYLARGDLESAKSATLSQRQNLATASRKLELLLVNYPSGKLLIDAALPKLDNSFNLGIPADLLQKRTDLQSRWLSILIEDARAASSYAAQFPQFSLTGNLSLSSAKLADIFEQNLAWSLISNASQSLFDNGKKEAAHRQAKAKLANAEQQYLQTLQNAFSEVEGLLSLEKSLAEQAPLNQLALKNSQLSYEQVNVQYQNGIANFQQVLNVQQQLYNHQKSQLDLKMKRIDNRISLLLALGGTHSSSNLTETQ